jgi:carbon catabolite-derepressing protein kinase
LSPGGGDLEENPFEAEFNPPTDDEEYDDDDDPNGLDFSSPQDEEAHNFAVLNSSLPPEGHPSDSHPLSSYASAKRSAGREKRQHRTKWHFGIRSRSPPMEIMLEIYKTLKVLGMEWKEKKNLGGLGGVVTRPRPGGKGIERVKAMDGTGEIDMRHASQIYFIEARARVQNIVVS